MQTRPVIWSPHIAKGLLPLVHGALEKVTNLVQKLFYSPEIATAKLSNFESYAKRGNKGVVDS